MEEKERYELFRKHYINDNNPNAHPKLLDVNVACVVLNDQDKHIKLLEEVNQQLKHQLHDLPKKIVEEIKTEVEKEKSDNDLAWLGFKKLNRILDTILKKYGGEENGKSNMQ